MELTDRKKRILRAIVETYIATAEPVGSKAVAEQAGLDVSAATIRNEMADLTEMGLLEQPHTSAGRVPSAAGYRLYVNELMEQHRLTLQETERINDALNLKMEELDRVIDQAGKVLSQISDYPVFTMRGRAQERVTVKRYDLLMVEKNAFIVVVMTDTSVVKNKMHPHAATRSVRAPAAAALRTCSTAPLWGSTLDEMDRQALDEDGGTLRTRCLRADLPGGRTLPWRSLEERSQQDCPHRRASPICWSTRSIRSLDKAKPLMNYLSDEHGCIQAAGALDGGRNMNILIGPENVSEALKDTSVVMASYDIGDNMRGVIGVVGPTRMDYAKVAARLVLLCRGPDPDVRTRRSCPRRGADAARNRRKRHSP